MTIYVFRERLRSIYQKYDMYIEPILKFILSFIVFTMINKNIGYDTRLLKVAVVGVLSLLCAFTPSAVLVLLAGVVTTLHVYYVSKILSVIIILIIFILYLFFARLTPKLGIVVVAVPILYMLKIPYVVPIVLGLVSTPMAAFSTGCGVVVYYLFQIIKESAAIQVNASVEDTLQLYTYVCNALIQNKQMFITIFIFTAVIVVTYIVRRLKIDYAFEIAIGTGSITMILCFLISDLKLNLSSHILSMILGTIISAGIAYVVLFFKQALDYTGVENVQFEDDDYYYYVKAVPKINVTTPQVNVKRINPQKVVERMHGTREHDSEDREYEDDYSDTE